MGEQNLDNKSEAIKEPAGSGKRKPLNSWVLASYAAPGTALALAGLPLGVYLPAAYSDSDGYLLSLGVLSLLIPLMRISDVITDPWIGYYSDRIRTRWGRRKPFVLIGTPIYGAALYLLFFPPFEFSDITIFGATFSNGYVWLSVMLTLTYFGSTIKDIPFSAWGAELSTNYHERTLVMSWREGFGVAGSLISAFIPGIIVFYGMTTPLEAVFVLLVGLIIFMPLTTANALVSVPEYPVAETNKTRVRLTDSLKIVAKNRPYVLLVIIFAFSSMGAAMTNSLSFFFVKHVLIAGEFYGLYLAPYFICQIAAVPLWFKLSRKIGKHKATMYAIGWYALWSCFIPLIALAPGEWFTAFEIPKLLAWLPAETHASVVTYFEGVSTGKFLFFIIVMCFKGSSIGALSALPRAMCADVIDVDEAQTGKKQAGAYFSIWSMVQKGTYALGMGIGLWLVVQFGFDSLSDANPATTTNTWTALFALACVYSIIPAIFKFVGMPLLWKYPLTEDKVQEVQSQIATQNSKS